MKAVMKVAPGVGNIELVDIGEPFPSAGQVKIEVHAAGLCGTDLHIRDDEFRSWPPVVLGHEVSGVIVEVGEGAESYRPGDRVTTETYFSTCGKCRYCRNGQINLCLERRSIGSAVNGGFTRYLVVPEANLHRLPPNVSLDAGALSEPLACVVHGVLLNAPTVIAGDVAVIAGPGAIGLLTLQLVKAAGASAIVLGTSVDAHRLELARALGADHTLNVEEQDPLSLVQDVTAEGLGADVVYECAGVGSAARQLLALVRRRGRYVQLGLVGRPVAWNLDQLCYKELVATGSNASTPASWNRALALMSQGIVETGPLITHTFDVTEWEQAFNNFEQKIGVKNLLRPAG